MIGYDSQYDALAWGSHLPALLCAVGASAGAVIELGVGHFSTPALHALCGAMGRKLVSVEADAKWRAEFQGKMQGPMHEFKSTPSATGQWGCAFIDDSPGGIHRASMFLLLAPLSQFVVVHDYHMENEEAIGPLLVGFKFHVTKSYQPPTLIASRSELPESIFCL